MERRTYIAYENDIYQQVFSAYGKAVDLSEPDPSLDEVRMAYDYLYAGLLRNQAYSELWK